MQNDEKDGVVQYIRDPPSGSCLAAADQICSCSSTGSCEKMLRVSFALIEGLEDVASECISQDSGIDFEELPRGLFF